jgi:hypothetical protein
MQSANYMMLLLRASVNNGTGLPDLHERSWTNPLIQVGEVNAYSRSVTLPPPLKIGASYLKILFFFHTLIKT